MDGLVQSGGIVVSDEVGHNALASSTSKISTFLRGSRIQTATTHYGEAVIVTLASVLAEDRGKPFETFCK